jgi:hypothetical protein
MIIFDTDKSYITAAILELRPDGTPDIPRRPRMYNPVSIQTHTTLF